MKSVIESSLTFNIRVYFYHILQLRSEYFSWFEVILYVVFEIFAAIDSILHFGVFGTVSAVHLEACNSRQINSSVAKFSMH